MLVSLFRLLTVGAAIGARSFTAQSSTEALPIDASTKIEGLSPGQLAYVPFPDGASITGVVEAKPAGNNVQVFRGIPYAEAPIGPKRWKPSTLKPVTGATKALSYGNVCMGIGTPADASEDCLFLNIFAPADANKYTRYPVMVWIHGGALLNGASNSYDGHAIVKASGQKVIIVTINYRLGVFGFLSSKELLAEGNGTNFGMRDQEVAFQWVKKYIKYFGGDPNSVTAFGSSAGGWSIGTHLVSRDGNQKLFERAVLQSGVYSTVHDTPPPSVQQQKADMIASGVGCGNTTDVMSCLRGVQNSTLLASIKGSNWRGFPWMPVIDGKFLKDIPINLFRAGKYSRVPTIVGHNTDEGWMFVSWVKDESQFDGFLRSQFSMLTEAEYTQIKTLYPVSAFPTARHHAAEVYGDAIFTCPTQLLSQTFSGFTYRYRFNYAVPTDGYLIANHGIDAMYLFNQVGSIPDDDGPAKQVADHFGHYWTNFARTSSPNLGNITATRFWPIFNNWDKQEIVIQPTLEVDTENSYRPDHEKRCAFWLGVEQRIANDVKFAWEN